MAEEAEEEKAEPLVVEDGDGDDVEEGSVAAIRQGLEVAIDLLNLSWLRWVDVSDGTRNASEDDDFENNILFWAVNFIFVFLLFFGVQYLITFQKNEKTRKE